jgi:hypothetical protein
MADGGEAYGELAWVRLHLDDEQGEQNSSPPG